MKYLLNVLLSLFLFTICSFPVQAWKIKFYGSGGVVVEGGTIKKICPEKADKVCAVLDCIGFSAIVTCIFLKVFTSAPLPAQPVLLDPGLIPLPSYMNKAAPQTVQSLRLIRM